MTLENRSLAVLTARLHSEPAPQWGGHQFLQYRAPRKRRGPTACYHARNSQKILGWRINSCKWRREWESNLHLPIMVLQSLGDRRVPSSAKVTPRRYSPPSPVASLTLSRHAPIRMRRPPLTSRIMSSRCRRHFGSGRVRFRSGAIVESGTA
jgi:hypothetical protein